jgi:heme A synthase
MGQSEKGEYYFDENRVQKSVTFIGLVFAVMFLVGAMWALWRERDNTVARLAIVTGFVVAFAAWVGFFTSMSRREVIVATAAYAAVLVVFVNSGG